MILKCRVCRPSGNGDASCLHYCETGRRASLTAAGPHRPNIIMSKGRCWRRYSNRGRSASEKCNRLCLIHMVLQHEVLYNDAVGYRGCARGGTKVGLASS